MLLDIVLGDDFFCFCLFLDLTPKAKATKAKINLSKLTVFCIASESESHSVVSDSVTPWTTRSMDFSRPAYWSG